MNLLNTISFKSNLLGLFSHFSLNDHFQFRDLLFKN
jgi:hypothetical protein